MNILTNEKTIRRNSKIGTYLSFVAFALMLVGIYFSFRLSDPQFAKDNANYVWWMTGALFTGFILFQIGTYFMNRFGRRPRPDEMLVANLKGMTKDYTLYNHLTPVSHLLVGPAGVWVIEPYYQRGKIGYEKNRWTQKGGGLFVAYMKIFAQEGLGRPDLEVKADLDSLSAAFKKALGEQAPAINAALVFTDPRSEVDAEDAPMPTMKIKDLKEFLRKYAKEHPFTTEQIKQVTSVLPDESIE
jgi:hypothetical protein